MPTPATATHHHPPPPLLPPTPITANPSTATTHLSHPALTPPTSSIHSSSVVVVVEGGRGEKLQKICFAPNKLKSPKNKMSFYYFFLLRGVGGWVKSLIEKSINFFMFLNPSLSKYLYQENFEFGCFALSSIKVIQSNSFVNQ